jgi:glutathione synthase/RimK-type ligase-like ATP-grasp enzyme
MRLKLLPYKRGSRSAKALAQGLNIKRIVSPGYRQRRREQILNWGACQPSQRLTGTVLNNPVSVARASNKMLALRTFTTEGVPTVEHTIDADVAVRWLRDGFRVMARHLLNSHSGRGIKVHRPDDRDWTGQDTVDYIRGAPLYTKYFKKDAEFRVHVVRGQVIDFARKKRRDGMSENPAHEPLIRNHANGWVFCRQGVELPPTVGDAAIKAVATLGLDFGAVDVCIKGEKVAVLEVNTAPGLEGTTLQRYVEAFNTVRYNTSHYVNRSV